MEDLLQSQIRESCRLALPEGLRDLMSDISREVLRAQPHDLYNFIASYLKAMLVARETLCVACRVCRDVCQCICDTELDDELRYLGLNEEDLETARNVVMEYFDKDEVKEGNLLMKLFRKTNIDTNLLPDIQEAVRRALLKHMRVQQAGPRARTQSDAVEKDHAAQNAVKHTLDFHERVQHDKEQTWDASAIKVQASFRGHFKKRVPFDDVSLKLRSKLAQIESTDTIVHKSVKTHKEHFEKATTSKSSRQTSTEYSKKKISLSSTSLAGSLVNLPRYIPYSIHDVTYFDFEERETESKNIDYTLHTQFRDTKKEEGTKKIAFHEQHVLHEIKSCSVGEEDVIEEHIIAEDIASETDSIDENISEEIIVNYNCKKLKGAVNKGFVDYISFAEDVVQQSVLNIDTPSKSVGPVNSDTSFEETLSVNEPDYQHDKDFGKTSFDGQYDQKYFGNYVVEEGLEHNEYQKMEKKLLIKELPIAGMRITKNLTKKLNKHSIVNDHEYSSSDDED